jgi:hypothetical protein
MNAEKAAELLSLVAPVICDVNIQLAERAKLQVACTRLLRQYGNVECCRRCDSERCVPCRVAGEDITLTPSELEAVVSALKRCREQEQHTSPVSSWIAVPRLS